MYEAAGCTKPVRRLWISSLTTEAIRDGFARLRDGRELAPLADAARGRSRADWLVGMNLSRAYSLAYDQDLSVGRVQTPTLAMVAEREKAIRSFVPEDYLEVVATFLPRRARRRRQVHRHLVPRSSPRGAQAGAPPPPPQGRRRGRADRRRAPSAERRASSPSIATPAASRRPCSTISPSSSATPTASSG